ncbi:MAG: PQQ-dependent sugar dehydrogenase [bacterium]|nr:PQQ-dependent sugar dehydrogenase [bacterium]
MRSMKLPVRQQCGALRTGAVRPGRRLPATALVALAWLTVCAASVEAQVGLLPVLSGLDQPVRLVAPPGDPRLFVVEKPGRIRVFAADGTDRGVFLNLAGSISSGGERGLLGLAFSPDYANSGRLYVDYTDAAGNTRLVRYVVSANPDRADAASADTLLTVGQPFSNHNGGHLEFGLDGMLYVGLGDGGSGGDPGNRAQDGATLLGKLLRLDVSGPGYVPAAGNPFIGSAPLDEIWALGLRNPWCFTFDTATGDLYVADVGQNAWEEIDVVAAGAAGVNYGWRRMEGTACYNPATNCNTGSLTLPVHQYEHGGDPFRCSVSGGYVYRGAAIPSLQGTYLFADYCSRQVWGLRWTVTGGLGSVTELTNALTPTNGYTSISSFGRDAAGELYIIDHGGGRIYRIVPTTSGTGPVPGLQPRLGQNLPNPFNPQTRIPFYVPVAGVVTLSVHDLAGHCVRTLVRGVLDAGEHAATWDGRGDDAKALPSGVYLARLEAAGGSSARKLVLAR